MKRVLDLGCGRKKRPVLLALIVTRVLPPISFTILTSFPTRLRTVSLTKSIWSTYWSILTMWSASSKRFSGFVGLGEW